MRVQTTPVVPTCTDRMLSSTLPQIPLQRPTIPAEADRRVARPTATMVSTADASGHDGEPLVPDLQEAVASLNWSSSAFDVERDWLAAEEQRVNEADQIDLDADNLTQVSRGCLVHVQDTGTAFDGEPVMVTGVAGKFVWVCMLRP